MLVLHLLFGIKQLGVCMIRHDGRSVEPGDTARRTAHGPMTASVRNIVTTLMDAHAERAPMDVHVALTTALVHAVAHSLQSPTSRSGRKAHHTFQNVCLYVQEHIQEPLTRESVADEFRLNPSHLSRLFRQEGAMKFTDYLSWVRVDRAKFLLRRHDLTVDEVAADCGFNDTAYFCRVFKRRTKFTPSEYRRAPHR